MPVLFLSFLCKMSYLKDFNDECELHLASEVTDKMKTALGVSGVMRKPGDLLSLAAFVFFSVCPDIKRILEHRQAATVVQILRELNEVA